VPCTGASRIHALRSFIRRDGATGRASPTPWFSLELLPFSLHGWREMRGVRERTALLARRFPEQLPRALGGCSSTSSTPALLAAALRLPPRAFFVFDGIERDHVRLCREPKESQRRMVRAAGWPRFVDDVSAVRPGRPGSSTSIWDVPQTLWDTAGMVRVVMLLFSSIARTRESCVDCVDFDKAAGCVSYRQ
jgi:hypothetical protein